MPQFKFQLEGVLRQRKYVEEQRQRELGVVQTELAALEDQLRQLDQSVQSTVTDLRDNRLTGRIDLNFLAGHRRYMLAMQRKALGLAQQIANAQKKMTDARRVLVEAAKQRKIIEKLRERRHATWTTELTRKETAALDEIGTQIGYRLGLESALAGAIDPDVPAGETETSS